MRWPTKLAYLINSTQSIVLVTQQMVSCAEASYLKNQIGTGDRSGGSISIYPKEDHY